MIPGFRSPFIGALLSLVVMLCALTFSAGAAQAAEAYTITNVSMRAGPSTAYPRILVLNAGTPVTVYGCLQDYSWCDTSFEDNRGWVAGSYLDYPYQGNRAPIPTLGAQLGLTILNFALDDYWGNYYRNRPFYGRRDYWDRHPPRPVFVRPPHRPRPPAVRPPPRPQPPTVRPPRPKPPGPGPGTKPPRPGQGDGGRPPRPGQGSGGKPPGPGPGAGKPPPGQGGGNRPGPGNRPDKPNPPPRPTTKPAPGTPNSN